MTYMWFELSTLSRSLIAFAAREAKIYEIWRHAKGTMEVTLRRPLKRWGDTLTIEFENGRFELWTALEKANEDVLFFFLGENGINDVVSITSNSVKYDD